MQFLTEVSEYRGEASVRVSATQLGTRYSAAAARRIVDEWVGFLAAGPSPIRELDFTSLNPAPSVRGSCGAAQLRSLTVKWGDYSDFVAAHRHGWVAAARFAGASGVHDLTPISVLKICLGTWAVEGFRDIRDLSPLRKLQHLTSLELAATG